MHTYMCIKHALRAVLNAMQKTVLSYLLFSSYVKVQLRRYLNYSHAVASLAHFSSLF